MSILKCRLSNARNVAHRLAEIVLILFFLRILFILFFAVVT